MKKILIICISIFICLPISNCIKPSKVEDKVDRIAFLTYYADSLILPSFNSLNNDALTLKNTWNLFIANPNSLNLETLKQAWQQTYISWIPCNAYNFGPAGEDGIRGTLMDEIGIWPVDSTEIDKKLTTNTWSFTDFKRNTRGLNTLEYLIFKPDFLQWVKLKPSHSRYVQELIAQINLQTNLILNDWKTTYKTSFIANNGTSAGSSVAVLYNEFLKSYEVLKNFKLALPMGKRAGQLNAQPNLVETWYSGNSMVLFKLHFKNLVAIWNGSTKNGFKSYIKSAEGGTVLAERTALEIAEIETLLLAMPNQSIDKLITSKNPDLEKLYLLLQKNTRNFKSDMSSILGIAITFTSGDGD